MAAVTGDERVRNVGFLRRLLNRPELGAVGGAIAVFAFFAVVAGDRGFLTLLGAANYLEVAAYLGIIAVPVAMLMIAGEFDLSVGSMIGAAGIIIAIPVAQFGWPFWAALLLALVFAMVVGLLNGYLVVRTGLPSFIITLAGLFILRGVAIGFTRLITGRTQVGGLGDGGFLGPLFAGSVGEFSIAIFWWIAIAIVATWILRNTAFGNWIFGTGGDPVAARNVGVPVNRVKIILFMATAASAALVAAIQVMSVGSADVLRGELRELEVIICAVVGGTLLRGGYGSVIGASFGALIFGMVSQGIFFMGVNTDWYSVFVGAVLLAAVLINNYIRKKAAEAR